MVLAAVLAFIFTIWYDQSHPPTHITLNESFTDSVGMNVTVIRAGLVWHKVSEIPEITGYLSEHKMMIGIEIRVDYRPAPDHLHADYLSFQLVAADGAYASCYPPKEMAQEGSPAIMSAISGGNPEAHAYLDQRNSRIASGWLACFTNPSADLSFNSGSYTIEYTGYSIDPNTERVYQGFLYTIDVSIQ